MNDVLHGRRPRTFPVVASTLFALVASTSTVAAQTATVRVQENFRADPNGMVLGTLAPGTELRVVSRQGPWLEVEARGWMWLRSLQARDQGDMDLVISEGGGENLRSEPSGRVLGRLNGGTLLEEAERIPGWARVSRTGWLWGASARVEDAAASEAAAPPAATPSPAPAARRPSGGDAGSPASGGAAPAVHRTPAGGAAILASPDGDTLARAASGAELPVLARQGSWARVRIDGWVWMPERVTPSGTAPPAESAGEATPSQVSAAGEAWRGRLVTWELQFVARERAEKVRTDFYEGEPFLLARHADGAFVYVAVPPDRLAEVEGLIPLERIAVTGRVRVAASDPTGSPILDLVELRRVSGP